MFSSDFHKEFSTWLISTHEIGIAGRRLTCTVSEQALSALLVEPNNETFSWKACQPSTITYCLERENDYTFRVFVSGEVWLNCCCVRCLSTITQRFALNFSMHLLEKARVNNELPILDHVIFDSVELDCDQGDDSSVGYFSNKCIDVGLILRDHIFLTVPDYPQCQDSGDKKDGVCEKSLPIANNSDVAASNPFIKLLSKTK